MNRFALLGVACCLSFGIAPISVQANTLLGDVMSGTYDYPCASCDVTLLPGAGGSTAAYSTNPFVVDGTVETVLTVNPSHGDFTTNVNVNADSFVLTITKAVSYVCCNPFNGPEFTVLSGNSFGSILGVSVSNGLPV